MDPLSLLGAGGTVAARAKTATLQGQRAGREDQQADLLARIAEQRQAEQDARQAERDDLYKKDVLARIANREAPPAVPAPQYDSSRGGYVSPGQPFQPVQGLPTKSESSAGNIDPLSAAGIAAAVARQKALGENVPPRTTLPTSAERKNAGLYRTGKLGYDTLERLVTVQDDPTTPKIESGNRAAPRLRDRLASKFGGGVGNFLSSDELRQQDQAAYDLSEAWLRLTSGAVIGPEEIKNSARAIIPQPGDDDATLTQKRHARKARIDAIRASAGRAVDPNVVGQEPDETDGLDAQIDAVLNRRP